MITLAKKALNMLVIGLEDAKLMVLSFSMKNLYE